MINTLSTSPRAARTGSAYPVTAVVNGRIQQFQGDNIRLFVRPNSEFAVSLPEPSGTGYIWQFEGDAERARGLELIGNETALPKGMPPHAGAPAFHEFKFKLDPGAATGCTFKLVLNRPWSETVPPASEKTITLAVGFD